MKRIVFLTIACIAGQAQAMLHVSYAKEFEACDNAYRASLEKAIAQNNQPKVETISAALDKCLDDGIATKFKEHIQNHQQSLKDCATHLQIVAKACKSGKNRQDDACRQALYNYRVVVHRYNLYAKEIIPNRASSDDLFFEK